MRITIDVDCTPDEARRFLGLPDVAPMQSALIDEVHKRMMANLEAMEPETIVKTWLPIGLQGLESAQKMFWSQMQKAASEAQRTMGQNPGVREKKSEGSEAEKTAPQKPVSQKGTKHE
jgi:Family of unknown function (DUF6489)